MYVFSLLCSLPTDAQVGTVKRGGHLLDLKYLLEACSATGTEDATVEKELSSLGLGARLEGKG